MKNDTLLSITFGSCIGFIGGLSTDKIMEVMILSFIGGMIGAAGGTLWRCIKNRCRWMRENDQDNNE